MLSASISPLRMCLKPMRIICDGVSAAGAYARTLLAGLWFRSARKPLQRDTNEPSGPFAWAMLLAMVAFGPVWICLMLCMLASMGCLAVLAMTTLKVTLWLIGRDYETALAESRMLDRAASAPYPIAMLAHRAYFDGSLTDAVLSDPRLHQLVRPSACKMSL